MEVQEALRTDVETVVNAAWPEVSVVFRGHQAERRAYQNVVLPFAVMTMNDGAEAEWGTSNIALERWIEFHYLKKWHDQAEDVIRERIGSLKRALIKASYPLSSATLLEVADDTSPESPLNLALLAKNLELVGGTLRCRYVAGESAFD